jgi:prepilin-type N-terminal cleavage/methylation domain-containing protein
MRNGFSLIEIMVAISLFAILSVSITMISAGILRGAARGKIQIKVRNEAQYAMSLISQGTRFSSQVTPCGVTSSTLLVRPNLSPTQIQYQCSGDTIFQGTNPVISTDVKVSNCWFSCTTTPNGVVDIVTIHFEVKDQNELMQSPLIFDSQINLRNKL